MTGLGGHPNLLNKRIEDHHDDGSLSWATGGVSFSIKTGPVGYTLLISYDPLLEGRGTWLYLVHSSRTLTVSGGNNCDVVTGGSGDGWRWKRKGEKGVEKKRVLVGNDKGYPIKIRVTEEELLGLFIVYSQLFNKIFIHRLTMWLWNSLFTIFTGKHFKFFFVRILRSLFTCSTTLVSGFDSWTISWKRPPVYFWVSRHDTVETISLHIVTVVVSGVHPRTIRQSERVWTTQSKKQKYSRILLRIRD